MHCWGACGARMAPLGCVAPLLVLMVWCLLLVLAGAAANNVSAPATTYFASSMSLQEKQDLRDTAKEMFFHAYNAYMENAYPADELQPLSCKPRWRHTPPSRGDIDEALGNFSLTLVDSLDTLVVLGELDEFERAVKLVVRDVRVDADLVVSVFETNIRVLGGLLSAHVLAEHFQQRLGRMSWYKGELLNTAKELGMRLLPAFNTSTGIPHPRINLLRGMAVPQLAHSRETCTACAGTMLLEFAALSRLTGETVFEERAHRAMDALWEQRHRGSDLVGTTINIHSGDWVRRDSGVGAGIDSYYEYCLKAYILLGDERYLSRFNRHYDAVMKYISQGPLLLDVHMHRPQTNARNYMDSLLAFWPGLQVLKGDVKSAIETHEMLYQVMQRHNFLPEAFTTDFQVHWGQHLLRPEFVESTYLLYHATGDPYYLLAGKRVLQSLQRHAWVPCGFAAVKDVRTGQHEDRLDSFVLAETFKYLYLLFADPADLVLDIDDFVFSTEAHLFPLSLARLSGGSEQRRADHPPPSREPDVQFARTCPNTDDLTPGAFSESVRRPLSNLVEGTCPSRRLHPRTITAAEFQPASVEHRALVQKLGVTMATLPDGRVQLLHSAATARSPSDAEEGLLFMQEMVELSRQQLDQPENPPRAVMFRSGTGDGSSVVSLPAGPAQFGPSLSAVKPVTAPLLEAAPLRGCTDLSPPTSQYRGSVVIMERGDCMFVEKARNVQKLGAVAGIVVDNAEGTTADSSPVFAMSGDGTDDVSIPLVFLFRVEGDRLRQALRADPGMMVTLSDASSTGRNGAAEAITGVGHVVAVEAAHDQLSRTSDVTASGDDVSGADDQSQDAMSQVRAWLRDVLQMSDAELSAVAGPETTPLLRDVAALGPQRLAELQRRLKADAKSRSSQAEGHTAAETQVESLVNAETQVESWVNAETRETQAESEAEAEFQQEAEPPPGSGSLAKLKILQSQVEGNARTRRETKERGVDGRAGADTEGEGNLMAAVQKIEEEWIVTFARQTAELSATSAEAGCGQVTRVPGSAPSEHPREELTQRARGHASLADSSDEDNDDGRVSARGHTRSDDNSPDVSYPTSDGCNLVKNFAGGDRVKGDIDANPPSSDGGNTADSVDGDWVNTNPDQQGQMPVDASATRHRSKPVRDTNGQKRSFKDGYSDTANAELSQPNPARDEL